MKRSHVLRIGIAGLVALLVAGVAVTVLWRASGDDGASGAATGVADAGGETTSTGDTTGDLDCERLGYPCSWAEADEQAVAATVDLAEQADERLAGTDAPEEVAEWLADRDDVTDVLVDTTGLRFRVEGARPMWVGTDAAFGVLTAEDGAASRATTVTRQGERPPADPAGAAATGAASAQAALAGTGEGTVEPVGVVGDDPEEKHALILAPYLWQFGSFDESPEVAAILEGTRGYDGNVVYKANESPDSAEINPFDFQGWDAYDVVHVSTHGAQVCRGGDAGCFTFVSGGLLDVDQGLSVEETFRGEEGLGIAYARHRGTYHVGFSTDWFRSHAPGGLDDTLVWMSACQSTKGDDLATALAGDGGVFIGWDETVMSGDASAAATTFYEHVAETGVPASEGLEVVREAGLDRSQVAADGPQVWTFENGEWTEEESDAGLVDAIATLTQTRGADLRIREVVEIQDPRTGQRLAPGSTLFVRREADDRLPVRLEIDGIADDERASTVVEFRVDGLTVLSTDLGSPPVDPRIDVRFETSGEQSLTVVGTVPLPFRIEDPPEEVSLHAEIDPLPEGGRTEHTVEPVELTTELVLEVDAEVVQDDPGSADGPAYRVFADGRGRGLLTPIPDEEDLAGEVGIGFPRLELDIAGAGPMPPLSCVRADAQSTIELRIERARLEGVGDELDAEVRIIADPGGGAPPPEGASAPLLEGVPNVGDPFDGQLVTGGDGGCEGGPPTGVDLSRAPGMSWWAGYVGFQMDRLVEPGVIEVAGWEPGEGRVLLEWRDEVTLSGREVCGAQQCALRSEYRLLLPEDLDEA